MKKLILIGSQLSGDKDADIDMLVIVAEIADWKVERELIDICYEIDLKYDILTDVHVLSAEELIAPKCNQPIYVNAINLRYHV